MEKKLSQTDNYPGKLYCSAAELTSLLSWNQAASFFAFWMICWH